MQFYTILHDWDKKIYPLYTCSLIASFTIIEQQCILVNPRTDGHSDGTLDGRNESYRILFMVQDVVAASAKDEDVAVTGSGCCVPQTSVGGWNIKLAPFYTRRV